MDVISERKIRTSQSFRYLQDAYENCLQIKTDLVHSRVAAGLTHGLAISFQYHGSYHTERKNSGGYIAPTLMGIGQNTSKQLGQELNNQQIDQLDSFEKIFLCSQKEEYYPVQVCCGYGFSIVLAIEAKNMQWLESIGSSSDNKRDKMEFMQLYSEQIKEALSKSKVFIAGKISARRDDLQSNPVSSVKIDDKKQFFQFPPNSAAGQTLYHQQSSQSQQQQQQLRKEMSIQSLSHKQSYKIGNNNNPSPFKDQYYNNNNNNPEQQSLLDPNNNNNNNFLGLIADFDVDAYSQTSDDDEESIKKNKDNILSEEQSQYKLTMTETINFPQSKWTPAREFFITQISCGQNFCLALTYNYKVFAWGDNSFGNLGTGDFNSRSTPVLIKFEEGHGKHSKIASINCGHKHAAAVSVTGKLYTWGSGPHGQLGQKNTLQQSLPFMLKGELSEKTINLVSCGGHHTVCVTNEGYAYSWGMNRNGQLGQGDQRSRTIPTKINWLQNYFIINASCGVNNTFLFTQVGKLFACGNNANNKTGMNTIFNNNQQNAQSQAAQQQQQSSSLGSVQENWIFPTPMDTNFLKGADKSKLKDVYIYQIAASTHFTYSLSNCGLLSTWGLQINSCLGRRISAYVSEGLGGVDKILNNMQVPHTVAAKLGVQINSSSSQQKFFFPIINTQIFKASGKDFISSEIIDIQLGSYHTMALTNAGEVYIWGSNQFGQHGCGQGNEIRMLYQNLQDRRVAQVIPELSRETMPSPVTFFNIQENRRITYIAAGAEYCMAIENKRLVFAWGRNSDGQLGIGKIIPYVDTPQMVLGLEGNLMKAIACGETHTLFLTDTGRVYSCGSPKEGKLGLGQRSNTQLQPQLIDQLTKVLEIACGATHSMALAQDSLFPVEEGEDEANNRNQITKSAIYTWGSSWESKLGHGDKENLTEPTKIQTNFQFKSISAGNHHSAALTLDETLVVWGPFRYFGHTRPDESNKNKRNNSNSSNGNGFTMVPALNNFGGNGNNNPLGMSSNAEQSEFTKPTLHPKIIEKIRYVSLGDKSTLLVTKKENRVIMFGIFEQDLRELKKTNNIDFILDKLVPSRQEENEVPVNEINKISVAKDHVAILGKNQVYSWGFDNYTGRLGHGYTFLGRNKNIDRMEDDSEADQIGQLSLDLNQKFEKPEYCNYINKYLQEQLIEFKKKQITGGKEEYDKLSSSDYESEAESEGEDISVIEGEGVYPSEEIERRKRTPGNNYTNATYRTNNPFTLVSQASSPSRPINGKKYTVASSVMSRNYNNTGGDTVMSRDSHFKGFPTPRHQTLKATQPNHFQPKKDKGTVEKSSAQEAYIQFFLAPAVVKSTYEKLMSKDKPDLYSIINEPFGLLNEERILYLYDKVSSIQTEIQIKYSQCQAFLASNKQFVKASQSQILNRLSTEPFNVKFNDKNIAASANPPYLLPFTNNKFFYKKIFTLMQLHPCYLLRIYQKKMDKDQFIELVKETFGDLENSLRKQRIYAELCKKILLIDTKNKKEFSGPIQLDTSKETSLSYVFVKLFKHFYESLSENIRLNRQFRVRMKKLYDDIIQANSSKFQNMENLFTLDRAIFENDAFIKTEDQIKDQLEKNQQALKDYLVAFFKDSDFLNGPQGQNAKILLCEKLRELASFAYDLIQLKKPTEIPENIQNALTGIIIESMLDYSDQLTQQAGAVNYSWIMKGVRMLINLDENNRKKQDLNNFIEYVKSQDEERARMFKKLFGKQTQKKTSTSFDQIIDIYQHSIESSDDVIFVSLSTIEKFTKFISKNPIQFHPVQAEDFFFSCIKRLSEQEPNFVVNSVDPEGAKIKVKLRLETRQVFYSSNQAMKKCTDCETILQRDFLRSSDKELKEQFLMFNPQSLEACGMKAISVITKQTYDDLLNVKLSTQQLYLKQLAKKSKDKNSLNTLLILNSFNKAFESAFELEYSNKSQQEQLIIPSDLSRDVLKVVKRNIDNQVNQVVKYYSQMETLYRAYFQINILLQTFASQTSQIKGQQFRMLTNCYYGLANREIEKVIERDPMAITSKISSTIHGMSMSKFLYENIDAFANRDLTTLKDKFSHNNIHDHFIRLNMFGEYSLSSLQMRDVIKNIDDSVVGVMDQYITPSRFSTVKTRKNNIERCLFFIFTDFGNKDINVDVVYKAGEYSLLTILCGIANNKELRIDQFKIDQEMLLSIRKERLKMDLSKAEVKFGFTTFFKKGLVNLIERMQDHYSIYEYVYSSNNCTD